MVNISAYPILWNYRVLLQLVKEFFIITRIYGAFYELYHPKTGVVRAVLRGRLRKMENEDRHLFVVGDRVRAENSSPLEWVIEEKLERQNQVSRKSSQGDHHVLCGNLDLFCILASLKNPQTKSGFIDRLYTAASSSNIPALIVFTKKDLVGKEELEEMTKYYADENMDWIAIDCQNRDDVEIVRKRILGKTVFLAGISGVGKSTLINHLHGSLLQKTNEVSESTGKGRHTTTNTHAFLVGEDTLLVDSPGVKEWGLLHLDKGEVLKNFPGLKKYSNHCSSSHCCTGTIYCEIRKKLEEGCLPEERQKNLDSILQELESESGKEYPTTKGARARNTKKREILRKRDKHKDFADY